MSRKKRFFAILCACLVVVACSNSNKDDLLRQANAAREERNHRGAIVLLKSLLEKDSDNENARFLLADSYLQIGKFEIAEAEFRKLRDDYPDLPMKLAHLYNQTGRPRETIGLMRKYLAGHPASSEAIKTLAEAHLSLGELDRAEENYRQALRAAPETADLVLGLADVLLRRQKIAEVEQLVDTLVQREPGNATAHFYLGRLENLRGNRNGALQHFLRVIDLDPNHVPALYTVGLLRLEKGELEEAARLGRLLREKYPDQTRGYQLLGFVSCVQGNFDEAVLQLQKVADVSPDPLTSYMLGMSYYKLEQLELAVNQFQRVLDLRPQAVQPRLILAAILLRQERVDDAITAINRVLREDDRNALAHSTLGSAYLKKGLFDQAMAEFDRAIELDPKLLEAHYRKGLFKEKRGELREAEEDIVAALAIAPELPDLRLLLARNYLRQEKPAESIRTLKEGLTGQDTDAVLYNFLAIAYFADRKNGQGIASLQKAKELKPDYLTPYYNLAAFYVRQRDYVRSRQEYSAILARKPDDLRAILFMALTSELAGEEKEADKWYRKARQSGDPAGFVALANYLQRTGKSAEALQALDELAAQDPRNPLPREIKGKVLLAARDYAGALEAFTMVDRIKPERGSLLLSETYLQQGNLPKARETARRHIERAPNQPAGYLALAAVLVREGKRSEAVKTLKDAASRLKDDLPLRMQVAGIYELQGDSAAADAIYRQLLQENENFYPALFALGALHEKKGDKERAIEFYRQALLHNPDFPPALNNLAYVYADSVPHREEALEMALRAYRIQPENPAILDTLGYTLHRNGRHDDACRVLEKAAVLLPDVPSVHYHLALACERLGKQAQSVKALRRAIDLGPFPEAAAARNLLEKISTGGTTGKI